MTFHHSVAHPPGVVVAHSPAASRQHIGSPGLAVLSTGEYVASHDYFGPGSTNNVTRVYASSDRGETWSERATIRGQWWSTLFEHRQALYLFGTTKENGHCVIRRSTDGGRTWTEPGDGEIGLLHADAMYHCAPVPVVLHAGRVWRAMEEFIGPKWGAFRAFVMSAPEDADLLKASSWTSTNRIAPERSWLDGRVGGVLEGNVVLAPDGTLVNMLRVHQPSFDEVAAMMHVSADGTQLSFDPERDFVPMPGASKKFTIRYDAQTSRYWTLANYVPPEYRQPARRPDLTRNTLALLCSADLTNWDVAQVILQDPDTVTVGFQYPDWRFDGEDIVALARTAFPEPDGTTAHNAHDANWLTFHRIEGFRSFTI